MWAHGNGIELTEMALYKLYYYYYYYYYYINCITVIIIIMWEDGREMSSMHITMKAGVIHLHLLTFQPTTDYSIHILPKFKLSEMNSYEKQFSKVALAKKQHPKILPK